MLLSLFSDRYLSPTLNATTDDDAEADELPSHMRLVYSDGELLALLIID